MSVRPSDSRESLFIPFPRGHFESTLEADKIRQYEQEKEEYEAFFNTRNEFESKTLKMVVGPNPRVEDELEGATSLIKPLRRLVVHYLMPDPKAVPYYVSKVWALISQIPANLWGAQIPVPTVVDPWLSGRDTYFDNDDRYKREEGLRQRLLIQFTRPSSMIDKLKNVCRSFARDERGFRHLRNVMRRSGALIAVGWLCLNRKMVLWESQGLRDIIEDLYRRPWYLRYFSIRNENPELIKELEKCRSLFDPASVFPLDHKYNPNREDTIVKAGQDEYSSKICMAREYFICRQLKDYPKPSIEEETNFNCALAKLAISEFSHNFAQKTTENYGPVARIKKFVKRFSPY